jgi:hypothetical protein
MHLAFCRGNLRGRILLGRAHALACAGISRVQAQQPSLIRIIQTCLAAWIENELVSYERVGTRYRKIKNDRSSMQDSDDATRRPHHEATPMPAAPPAPPGYGHRHTMPPLLRVRTLKPTPATTSMPVILSKCFGGSSGGRCCCRFPLSSGHQ